MSKKSTFTTITPIPAGVSRETVMATLRNHVEMIDLNPLVIDRFQVKAPSFASPEEFHSVWYEIVDKISYLPGGLAKGDIHYHGCFHDLPEGLQTHVYAPLGLDLRSRWILGGNLPGEPAEAVELGLGIPKQGLYLREDVTMKCNVLMGGFVKKNIKNSHGQLVSRLMEKAKIVEVSASNASLVSAKRASTMSSQSPAMGAPSPALSHGTPTMGAPSPAFSQAGMDQRPYSMMSQSSSGSVPSVYQHPQQQAYPGQQAYGQQMHPGQQGYVPGVQGQLPPGAYEHQVPVPQPLFSQPPYGSQTSHGDPQQAMHQPAYPQQRVPQHGVAQPGAPHSHETQNHPVELSSEPEKPAAIELPG
ncbi:hypothetical protein BT63DRAFT_412368 [Microthyrium microscopicum]|uniref:DUF7053 domain-containing protein n=1 Tax=Microthyrium microscopicum TaxID=703497 RepID=A0A6A6UHN7_9PEZI|nr:hypothetical protein BT63DRAFT_412368 [Microthyrium microscopicum]